mgnify:CR=1 FL=1
MSQPVVLELRQVYDLWQNGLTARSVYEAATKELLGKLLSDDAISLSDKHQGLKAAKQYVTNQSLLLESGNKLVQMRLQQFSSGGTAGRDGSNSIRFVLLLLDSQIMAQPAPSHMHKCITT